MSCTAPVDDCHSVLGATGDEIHGLASFVVVEYAAEQRGYFSDVEVPPHEVVERFLLQDLAEAEAFVDVPALPWVSAVVGVFAGVVGLHDFGDLLPDAAVVAGSGGFVEGSGEAVAGLGAPLCGVVASGEPCFALCVGFHVA